MPSVSVVKAGRPVSPVAPVAPVSAVAPVAPVAAVAAVAPPPSSSSPAQEATTRANTASAAATQNRVLLTSILLGSNRPVPGTMGRILPELAGLHNRDPVTSRPRRAP